MRLKHALLSTLRCKAQAREVPASTWFAATAPSQSTSLSPPNVGCDRLQEERTRAPGKVDHTSITVEAEASVGCAVRCAPVAAPTLVTA